MITVVEILQLSDCVMATIITPRGRVVPTEPFFIPWTPITGMEAPLVRDGLARLVFWFDAHDAERQIVAKLTMHDPVYAMVRRMLGGKLDGR